jgi:two-component system sensor histidine kinase KdpD
VLADGAIALAEAAALQAAAALESARRYQEVMELERLKRDFINRVSHELRTPITIIGGFLSTLISHDEEVDAEQRRHMLERSLAASDRLGHLIEDLLVLSRLEAGVLTPALATAPRLAAVEATRASSADPGAVSVEVPAHLVVRTDPVLFQRALGFVVDNSLKYAGHAAVRADGPTSGDPRLIALEVRDRGPGIARDVRGTLFEMFTRGASTTEVPGLGVGLPVARTLLEIVGADIEVMDPPDGPGALVRIRVPAAVGVQPAQAARPGG